MSSISARITIGFYALAALILLLFFLTIADLQFLQSSVNEGAVIASFVECVMETRRQEKNYFLYHEDADLLSALQQSAHVLNLFDNNRALFTSLCRGRLCAEMRDDLHNYHALLSDVTEETDIAKKVRQLGHRITQFAQELSKYERSNLAAALTQGGYWLLGAMLIMVILGTIVGSAIVRRVVKPLRKLENDLASLAAGNFRELVPPSADREMISFTVAFNNMLDELDKRRRQLLHAEKLASLGILVSGVAHELNNPLANISTSCQLALEEINNIESSPISEWLYQIKEQIKRAQRIVHALTDYAQRRPLAIQALDVKELLDKTMFLLRKNLGRQVTIEYQLAAGLQVLADEQQLQQVFINLLQNAAYAGDAPITITITARLLNKGEYPIAKNYQLGAVISHKRRYILISIIDNGQGMTTQILEQIFNPFFTTRAVGKGMGLGLYIVQEIIQELEGIITVESIPGKGTCFEIILPSSG